MFFFLKLNHIIIFFWIIFFHQSITHFYNFTNQCPVVLSFAFTVFLSLFLVAQALRLSVSLVHLGEIQQYHILKLDTVSD